MDPGIEQKRKLARERSKRNYYAKARYTRYGITKAHFEMMLEFQKGKCAICRTDIPGGRGGWCIDHDHKTGVVRGLLCFSCNVVLGLVKDRISTLTAAITYLQQ